MLRNREIQRFLILFVLISLLGAVGGFVIEPAAVLPVLFLSAAFGVAFFVFTRARYKSIAQISHEIDRVLHKEEHLYMSQAEEGELSILESEITKMTLRIREQNDALKREKQYLADSLADIAHQLRTPLTSANLILSFLKDNPKERERKSLLRETEELFIQMDWLVTSLLKLSRLDAGMIQFQREPLGVGKLIETALRPFLIAMELHNITLIKEIPQEAILFGDLGWLSEAVQNMVKNSMESAGDGGQIEIVCRDTLLFTEITIHDSGPGFEKEELPYLFERFYRGKKSKATGYGIGLALGRQIIVQQGGTVSAKNHPRGGAVFSVRFPKER
ncbi:MAG: HAMP domain-containing histidine kinase [Lachnospiraceae bacterium]|nr:HAMP domain-containing histidine kinase [Lachnospiraceae bacterium]